LLSKGNYMIIKVILLIISCLNICNITYAGSIKEEYELQERCGQSAAEYFKKEYRTGISIDTGTNYHSHYNRKLNKCFILIMQSKLTKDEKGRPHTFKLLIDLQENKEYAYFFKFRDNDQIMSCNVLDKSCSSESEWDDLVKPYMEE
jgi:hypothetical protein